jgi:hypothetical protein
MGSSYTAAIVSVKIFKESNVILKMFIIIKLGIASIERPLPILILQE